KVCANACNLTISVLIEALSSFCRSISLFFVSIQSCPLDSQSRQSSLKFYRIKSGGRIDTTKLSVSRLHFLFLPRFGVFQWEYLVLSSSQPSERCQPLS